jgi:hypothetical protein
VRQLLAVIRVSFHSTLSACCERQQARPETRICTVGALRRSQRVDAVVAAAHDRPLAAIGLIGRCASLATEPSSWGETALEAACHLGHRQLLAHLRQVGVRFDIFSACAAGDRRLISSVWRPACANAVGVHYLPLLHFAAVSRDVGVVELLLELGANPDPPAASLSPLHSAVAVASAPMISCLMMAGARTSAVDAFGSTPLDWAREMWGPGSNLLPLLRTAA